VILRTLTPRRGANCYVVGSEASGEAIVIDPSVDSDAVLHAVDELGLSLSLIVATHSHIDHIFAVKRIKEQTDAPFAVHEAERAGNMQLSQK